MQDQETRLRKLHQRQADLRALIGRCDDKAKLLAAKRQRAEAELVDVDKQLAAK